MSKKSRRRNKKILGLLGALGAGLAMANKRPKQSSVSVDSGRGSGLRPTVDDMEFKEQVVSVPIKKPKRRDSVLASPVINKMDTSEVDIPDNYFKKPSKVITRSKPDINKMDISEVDISENVYKKPLRKSITFGTRSNDGLSYFKKGGRVGCGKAKRGFGRAMKGRK